MADDSMREELDDIKLSLSKIMKKLDSIHAMQEDIKIFEGHQVVAEDKIAKAVKKKRFTSIVEWKNAIWERCPNKREDVGQDTVSFYCTLLKGVCRFEACPRNIVDDDDQYKSNLRP